MNLHQRNTRGYTLIEIIVAMGIFMMVTAFSIALINAAARQNTRLIYGAELLENARIGMDVIIAHVREAEEIKLTTATGTDTLAELVATVRKGGDVHEYKFTYNRNLILGQPRYHRIDFGGNELASYISDVTMQIKEDVLRILITTEENTDLQPVVLRANVDLKYKEIH